MTRKAQFRTLPDKNMTWNNVKLRCKTSKLSRKTNSKIKYRRPRGTSKLLWRAQCYKTKTFTSEYIKDHIFKLQRKIWRYDWSSQLYTHNLSSCEIKAWKNSVLNRFQTHDLCDTAALLHQLSYQANWELVTLWGRNIPVSGFRNSWHTNINWAQQWTKLGGFLTKRDC